MPLAPSGGPMKNRLKCRHWAQSSNLKYILYLHNANHIFCTCENTYVEITLKLNTFGMSRCKLRPK